MQGGIVSTLPRDSSLNQLQFHLGAKVDLHLITEEPYPNTVNRLVNKLNRAVLTLCKHCIINEVSMTTYCSNVDARSVEFRNTNQP